MTLRISGLFRDVFPEQIGLFDAAVRAIALREEAAEDNPLAASVRSGGTVSRVFGAAPGAYGIGLADRLADGDWSSRDELGAAYLRATSHAYGARSEGVPAAWDFRERVAQADAFVHVQDMAGQDVLDADAFAEHEAGLPPRRRRWGSIRRCITPTPRTRIGCVSAPCVRKWRVCCGRARPTRAGSPGRCGTASAGRRDRADGRQFLRLCGDVGRHR